MKAELNNYRQSPRKVRLVADLLRGKSVVEATALLDFVPKRAAMPIKKVLSSAVANAANQNVSAEDLVITEIQVNKGFTMKRSRPRSHGMANRIDKHTSKVKVVLSPKK